MIRIYTSILLFSFFISGCFSEEQKETIKENRVQLGEVKINYYSDKSVTSLEIPPDLTSPNYENSFRIREFAKDINPNTINLTDSNEILESKQEVLRIPTNIDIKTSGTRKWLVVQKSADVLWSLSKQFLRENGFVIEKINKETGVMETNYLENKPNIPAESMGWVRAALQSTIDNVSYTLPSVDSYKIRIEPINDNTSEVYLSITSMAEVISGSGRDETTYWQFKERDVNLETEMLYKLMLYFGGDSAKAREKIIASQKESKISISLEKDLNGFAKLVFNFGIEETWDSLSWAISNLNIDIEDKDIKEKSIYLNAARTADKGIMSKLFGDDAIRKVYRISLKAISTSRTEVLFYDVSEENEKETKDFSFDLMKEISGQFNK